MPEMIAKPCKGCGKMVYWVTTVAGKKMPLETDPKIIMTHVGKDRWKLVQGYEAHHAHCPQVDMFRKEKPDGSAS